MKDKQIVLTVEPTGIFTEGIGSGALAPGQCVNKTSAAAVSGRFTYAAGNKASLYLLREDVLQGRTVDDAYADGDRVSAYRPRAGDYVNVLVLGGTGALAIGAELEIDAAGKAVPVTTGTPRFEVAETITVGGTDTLVFCVAI